MKSKINKGGLCNQFMAFKPPCGKIVYKQNKEITCRSCISLGPMLYIGLGASSCIILGKTNSMEAPWEWRERERKTNGHFLTNKRMGKI